MAFHAPKISTILDGKFRILNYKDEVWVCRKWSGKNDKRALSTAPHRCTLGVGPATAPKWKEGRRWARKTGGPKTDS